MKFVLGKLVLGLMVLNFGSEVLLGQTQVSGQHNSYVVRDLGTLGGTQSSAYGINNLGWVTGAANLMGDQTEHPALWHNGRIARPGHDRGK